MPSKIFLVIVLCLMFSGCNVSYNPPKPKIIQFSEKKFKDDHFVCSVYTGIFYNQDCIWTDGQIGIDCDDVEVTKWYQKNRADEAMKKIIKTIILED
jgi:hypothetical protein